MKINGLRPFSFFGMVLDLVLLVGLATACNVSSISTVVKEGASGTNTVIVAVPNKDDCPSLLTTTRPSIEEKLTTLRTVEHNLGTKMDFETYNGDGLIGFQILYPFQSSAEISLQFDHVKEAMYLPVRYPMPTIVIQSQEDQFTKTLTVTVYINPSKLLPIDGDCLVDHMKYTLTTPWSIQSYSPNTNQPNLSVNKTGDTSVEWTLAKTDQTFTLRADSSIIKETPPPPFSLGNFIKANIKEILLVIAAIIGLIKVMRS